jgi:hypothetical protein
LYAKTSREINATARIFLGNLSQKSSALSILFEGGETLAIYDPIDIDAKKPQPLL